MKASTKADWETWERTWRCFFAEVVSVSNALEAALAEGRLRRVGTVRVESE